MSQLAIRTRRKPQVGQVCDLGQLQPGDRVSVLSVENLEATVKSVGQASVYVKLPATMQVVRLDGKEVTFTRSAVQSWGHGTIVRYLGR